MTAKYKCACCGQLTIEEEDFFEICPVCGWEDDPVQREDPDYEEGANEMSLNQARSAWANKYPDKYPKHLVTTEKVREFNRNKRNSEPQNGNESLR